jgi:hypothetical protein
MNRRTREDHASTRKCAESGRTAASSLTEDVTLRRCEWWAVAIACIGLAAMLALGIAQPAFAERSMGASTPGAHKPPQPIPIGYLVDGHNKCLTDPASSTRNGMTMKQWTCQNEDYANQFWYATRVTHYDGNVMYQIENVASKKCLELRDNVDGGDESGTLVQQWTCSDAQRNQEWLFGTFSYPGEMGKFFILDRNTLPPEAKMGTTLTVVSARNGAPARSVVFAGPLAELEATQLWTCFAAMPCP